MLNFLPCRVVVAGVILEQQPLWRDGACVLADLPPGTHVLMDAADLHLVPIQLVPHTVATIVNAVPILDGDIEADDPGDIDVTTLVEILFADDSEEDA